MVETVEMTGSSKENRQKMMFGLIVGVAYLLFAVLQFIAALGIEIPLVPGSFVGTLVLAVLGGVFLFGYKELNMGISEGLAYIHVGIMLSLLFGVIYLLVMLGDLMEAYLIGSEDYEDYTPLDSLRPELYLALLALAGYFKWPETVSLKELSKAGV